MAILTDSVLVDLITLVLGCVTLVYIYFQHAYKYWNKKGVRCLQPTFPVGNMKEVFLRKMHLGVQLHHLYKQIPGEKYIGFYLLHKPVLLLRDPDIIKHILTTDFQSFHDNIFVLDENADPLWGKTLLLLKGARWKRMRVKLTPVFSPSKLRKMVPLVAECSKRLQTYLQEPASKLGDVDMKDVIAKFTTDVVASCAFGIDCDCLNNPRSEFRLMGKKLMDAPDLLTGIKLFVMLFTPSIAKVLKLKFIPEKLSDFFRSVIRDTIRHRIEEKMVRNDFVDLLMLLKKQGYVEDEETLNRNTNTLDDNVSDVTDDDITAQALVFFIAGFETSSTTISMALYELALNPSYQKELADEIDRMLAKHNGSITFEAIQEMSYLDMVVQETLRKYPPVLFIGRHCRNDYRFENSDIVVEKGTDVYVPVYALHHDPIYYPNPDKFDPQRFSREMKQIRPNFAFLPFGEGPRICIGMKFGLLQVKMGLISILSQFEIHKTERTEVPITIDPAAITLVPKNGVWLKISNRRST